MHDTTMTLEDFESHLDRHGAAVDRWPADLAAQARRTLATSHGARELLDEARAIAQLLDDALPAGTLTTGALRSRILAEVSTGNPRAWSLGWPTGGSRLLRPVAVAALLIPLFIGYAIGAGSQSVGVNEDLASDVSLLAFADYETYTDAN
jgi:hypothetical protein